MVGFCQNPKKNLIIEHLVYYYMWYFSIAVHALAI